MLWSHRPYSFFLLKRGRLGRGLLQLLLLLLLLQFLLQQPLLLRLEQVLVRSLSLLPETTPLSSQPA